MTAFIAAILSVFFAFMLVQIPAVAIFLIVLALDKALEGAGISGNLWETAMIIPAASAILAVLWLFWQITMWCYDFILPLLGG